MTMNNLILHIEYLLHKHDCVIAPGLGAFIAVRHGVRYAEERNVLLPPGREVVFNASIDNNDGLLANSIARRDGISFEEAAACVAEAVDMLRQEILAEGSVEIGSLGSLSRNREGQLRFIPRFSPVGYAAMLGFEEVAVPNLLTLPEAKDDTPARVFDTARNYYIAVNKTFARVACTFIIIMCAVASVLIPASQRRQQDMASVVPAEIVRTIPTLNVEEKDEAAEEMVEVKTETMSEEQAAEASSEPQTEKRYFLIVGTFRNPAEADRFIKENEKKGWPLATVATRNVTRVYASTSDDSADLLTFRRKEGFNNAFPDSWIWNR